MIQVPYSLLAQMHFQQAVQKLANSPLKDPVAFQIKHMTKALRDGYFAMKEEYQKTIESKYAEKEAGKIVPPKEGSKAAELELPFACEDAKTGDLKGALDAFYAQKLKVEKKKIPFEVMFRANEWTPRELETLEAIIEEPTDA